MEAAQLDLLRADELDIALRLSYLQHSSGGGGAAGAGAGTGSSAVDDKEARRKEKKKQKDLKVCVSVSVCSCNVAMALVYSGMVGAHQCCCYRCCLCWLYESCYSSTW